MIELLPYSNLWKGAREGEDFCSGCVALQGPLLVHSHLYARVKKVCMFWADAGLYQAHSKWSAGSLSPHLLLRLNVIVQ